MTLAAPNLNAPAPIRVMLVDDSAVVRGLTKRWLESERDIEIVEACSDGVQAIEKIAAASPDVVILDVEMPRMDGLTALPQLRKLAPDARIVMASTLTGRGAKTTLTAMSLGAADYLPKPEANGLASADVYKRELLAKVRALGGAAQRAANPRAFPKTPTPQPRPRPAAVPGRGLLRPSAMVVASSTGGPQALQAFLGPIAKQIDAPILIVQHMPPTFTTILADKIASVTGRPCIEPKNGDPIKSGHIYLAPGDYHMKIVKGAAGPVVQLDQSPPVNFCRPAADPLFETASSVFGSRLLGVVLTGMGSDGKDGSGHIVQAGGRIIVQDEASSVVWGMPGAVATAGHAEVIKPIKDLSPLAQKIMNGDA